MESIVQCRAITTLSKLGYCKLSTPEHGNINFMNKRDKSGEMEGSQVSFHCHDNRIEPMKATCMKNGSWNPDPHTYKCREMDAASNTLIILSLYMF